MLFDPGEFLVLPEKQQREVLLAHVELPFDLDGLNREKAGLEERRREAGHEVKRLQGALASLPKPTPGTPAEEVSAQVILDERLLAESLKIATVASILGRLL